MKTKDLLFICYVVMNLAVHFSLAYGRDIVAGTCNAVDIQQAINSSQDGDTIHVPAGSCTWSTHTNCFPAVLIENKALTLKGAGKDQTKVTIETNNVFSGGCKYAENALTVLAGDGDLVRVTGFTFDGNMSSRPAINVLGTSKTWRIDNCNFKSSQIDSGVAIVISGYTYGVIDTCLFDSLNQGIQVIGDGDASWSRPLSLGSQDAVYVENCTFMFTTKEGQNAIDAYNGARYVFRHNTLENCVVGHHGMDSGNYRSTFSYEVYNNISKGKEWTCMSSRGGTGVIFNNVCDGDFGGNFYLLRSFRSCDDCGGLGECGVWKICNGSSVWDGNEALTDGSGSHTGGDNALNLEDTTKHWTENMWLNSYFKYIHNLSDKQGAKQDYGLHSSSSNSLLLVDKTKNWIIDEWVGYDLYNLSDNSSCRITANDSTSITCTLRGGTENDWDIYDRYFLRSGAFGKILANNNNVIETQLTGGIENDFDKGDTYIISNGYPCRDQIGRSTNQALVPLYSWNNRLNGSLGLVKVHNMCTRIYDHIAENRDYYNEKQRPGYTPLIFPHPLTANSSSVEAPRNLRVDY